MLVLVDLIVFEVVEAAVLCVASHRDMAASHR